MKDVKYIIGQIEMVKDIHTVERMAEKQAVLKCYFSLLDTYEMAMCSDKALEKARVLDAINGKEYCHAMAVKVESMATEEIYEDLVNHKNYRVIIDYLNYVKNDGKIMADFIEEAIVKELKNMLQYINNIITPN